MERKHSAFSNRYRQIGRSMLAAAYKLRAGASFEYNAFPGMVEEITRALSGRILDVGAAGGWLVNYLRKRGRETYGIDTDVEHLRGEHLVAGTPGLLPFRDKTFDGVFSGFCLSFVEDKEAALEEFARVTVPIGDLVLFLHHPDTEIRELHKDYLRFYERNLSAVSNDPLHVKQYTLSSAFIAGLVEDEDELRSIVVRAGYRVKALHAKQNPKPHTFNSFAIKDKKARVTFWMLRATREFD